MDPEARSLPYRGRGGAPLRDRPGSAGPGSRHRDRRDRWRPVDAAQGVSGLPLGLLRSYAEWGQALVPHVRRWAAWSRLWDDRQGPSLPRTPAPAGGAPERLGNEAADGGLGRTLAGADSGREFALPEGQMVSLREQGRAAERHQALASLVRDARLHAHDTA